MKQKRCKLMAQKNNKGIPVYRVTIPKAVVDEVGVPDEVELTALGPKDKGGPVWILEPVKKRKG